MRSIPASPRLSKCIAHPVLLCCWLGATALAVGCGPQRTADGAGGQWQRVPGDGLRIAGHTATLLSDGRVLIAGGYRDVSEGPPNFGRRKETYRYASEANRIGRFLPLIIERAHHAATLVGGDVILAGGLGHAGDNAEVLRASARAWKLAGYIGGGEPRAHAYATTVDGKAILAGGESTSLPVPRVTVERYDPEVRQWKTIGGFRHRSAATRFPFVSLTRSSQLLVAGGQQLSGNVLDEMEVFDVRTRQGWRLDTKLVRPRWGKRSVVLRDGSVLFIGGTYGKSVLGDTWKTRRSFERLSADRTTIDLVELDEGIARHTATRLADGRVLVLGGITRWTPKIAVTDRLLLISADGRRVVAKGHLPAPRYGHTATLMHDGSVLVVGGHTSGGALARDVLRYFPPD